MRTIVAPALRDWQAIIVAPDVPDENWTTELSRGAWHFVSRHTDLFAGAIVMVTGPGQGSLESLAETLVYIIHSVDDEVVEYGPTERLALDLASRGYPVQLMRLTGATHGLMGDYVGPLRAAGEWMFERWRAR
jgi:predicted esterase